MPQVNVNTFLSTEMHLEKIARNKYNKFYNNLLRSEKEIVFQQFITDRKNSIHINDKWKEFYN